MAITARHTYAAEVWPGGPAVPWAAMDSERPTAAGSRAASQAASDCDSDVDRERLVEHEHRVLAELVSYCWLHGARTRAACMGGHFFQLRANTA